MPLVLPGKVAYREVHLVCLPTNRALQRIVLYTCFILCCFCSCIRIYTRTGPNVRFKPIGGYHLFDGDGMMHTVRLAPEGSTYSNRYARTSRLAQEEAAGWPLFTKVSTV